MYEWLLQSSLLVRLAVTILPPILIVVPLALYALRSDGRTRDDDNVMTTAMRFVGAAWFICQRDRVAGRRHS
jgi:hypothetical protein